MQRTLIQGGRLLDPSQKLDATRDVLIEDGRIREIGEQLARKVPSEGLTVLDASGRWVVPGLVDMHVHLREPGREDDEDIQSGTRAAAAGGVTTVLSMPNTLPPVDDPAKVRWVDERAKATAKVHVLVAGAVTLNQDGGELARLGDMVDAGARAFTDDGRPVFNAQLMRKALELSRSLGIPIIQHCEDLNLTNGGCMNEGPEAERLGLPGIPWASEAVIAARDIELVRLTGGRLHLAHISCRQTITLLRRAKEDGLQITGEVCPHHFTLSDADIPRDDANWKMNPPLRSPADVEALQQALADGVVDVIATDHAPHSPDKKQKGFCGSPFGIIGLETLVPLSLRLVEKGLISPLRWAHLVSSGPAALLGLKEQGSLAPGRPADVTVVDPSLERRLDHFLSRSINSPFASQVLRGHAVAAFLGGRLVMRDGLPV